MNLVFNELSIHPISENGHILDERFIKLLETFKQAKDVYGFKHILFPQNYSILKITETETFQEWITNLTNRKTRDLLLPLCKAPFMDELETEELDVFFESNYELKGNDIPTDETPIGLPVSHIKAIPSISLDSHLFWRNRKIVISKSTANSNENIDISAFNICLDTDIATQEFKEWADMSMPKLIVDGELLKKYLSFTKYETAFSEDFMNQLFNWKEDDFKSFKYILLLMKDVQIHPFTGGMGQTENLKYRGKEASKRINNSYPNGDRLSYSIENNIVTFIACKGHYEFH